MRLRLLVGAAALVALWASCLPSGPDTSGTTTAGPATTAGSGAGGTPLPALCETSCAKKHPGGVQLYEAFHKCLVCGACHDKCATQSGCMPADGAEKGCSGMAMSCDACTVSECAVHQKPDTTFEGACANEGTACSKSNDCVAVQNCVGACIQTTGPGGPSGAGGAMASSGTK